jgi:hypothetical protein
MVFWPPTNGIFEPHTHGISTHYPWYFEPLPMVFWPPAYLLIRNEGGQSTMGVQFIIQGGQYTMGVKIPYDTGPFFIHDLSPDL